MVDGEPVKFQVENRVRVRFGSPPGHFRTEAAQTLEDKLTSIEKELIQTGVKTATDRLWLPSQLNLKLASLISVVSSADAAPTQQTYDVFEHLSVQIDEQLAQLKTVIDTDVPAFSTLLKEGNVPAIVT